MRNNTVMKTERGVKPPPEGPEYLGNGDTSNSDRACWALVGLNGFTDGCATDDCDAVADFLCDLMHLLDRMPGTYGTFEDNLRRARNNYDAEISPATGPLAEGGEA